MRTYETIFQHPISHNLDWHAVHTMFGKLGNITEESNGKLKVTRNGQTMVIKVPRTKDVADADDVMALRHFLQRSEAKLPQADEEEKHWLLVIDHHEARIFCSQMRGALPQEILPHEPDDYFRHAHNSMENARGKERPDPNTFFEPVAKALQGAGKVLIFGTGTGKSSEMEQFIVWVKKHHPNLDERIIGSLTVDKSHLTEDQLLAKAREFYADPSLNQPPTNTETH